MADPVVIKPRASSPSIAQPQTPSPPDLSRLKIAKKAYVFDVKRKYVANRVFNVKKKAETPAEGIKETLDQIFSKKKTMSDEVGGPSGEKKPAQGGSAIGTVVKVGLAVILLFVLAVAYIFIAYGSQPQQLPPAGEAMKFTGSIDYVIDQSIVLSSGTDQQNKNTRVGFILLNYDAKNLSALNFSAYFYPQSPPSQVFVLDHARDSAYYSYPIFRQSLSDRLSRMGISVNDISVGSLHDLPGGCVLVVPTGYFPLELLPEGNATTYRELLNRGVNIIYIGYEFDSRALDASGSYARVVNKDFTYTKSSPNSRDGFGLYDAQYVVQGASMYYGSVSSVRSGQGNMLFLPQTLDSGWQADDESQIGSRAAQDVARIVIEAPWLTPFANVSKQAQQNLGNQSQYLSLFSNDFLQDSGYVAFYADAVDNNGVFKRKAEFFQVAKYQKGEMYVREESAIPYFISSQKVRINIGLREDSQNPIKLYVVLFKDGDELQRIELEAGQTIPSIEKSVDIAINAPPGKYVVEVMDDPGKIYAATLLEVKDMDVDNNITRNSWSDGKFQFMLSAGGKPVSPRELTITLDGKGAQSFSSQDLKKTSTQSILTYTYLGKIEPGGHYFTFTSGDYRKSVPTYYNKPRNFWEDPLVIGLGVLSALIFAIGFVVRRPEALKYGLDIPDFPPISTIKIPVKRETVLEIFNNVNLSYSWKWMPLRIDEVKNGFRKLTYNGKPILVGDYNLERILSKLRDERKLKSELDYWGIADWERESRHTIRYLTLYRIMRNVFVNNAVKFSRMDAMLDCDIKAIAGKEEIYFHIMEEPADKVVHRALATAKNGTTIIVFATPAEKEVFESSLTSTSKLAVGLKMEMMNRNVFLMCVKNDISAFLKQKLV